MDIDRVRYFQVFAETGSLMKASEVLHISQPALSKALRVLQDEVGEELVQPDGRGLRLTEAGEKFRKASAPLLEQWMALPRALKSDLGVRPLRLGSFEVFTTYFLKRLAEFVDLTALDIHELGPGAMESEVNDGLVDLGITYPPLSSTQVTFVTVTFPDAKRIGRSLPAATVMVVVVVVVCAVQQNIKITKNSQRCIVLPE